MEYGTLKNVFWVRDNFFLFSSTAKQTRCNTLITLHTFEQFFLHFVYRSKSSSWADPNSPPMPPPHVSVLRRKSKIKSHLLIIITIVGLSQQICNLIKNQEAQKKWEKQALEFLKWKTLGANIFQHIK